MISAISGLDIAVILEFLYGALYFMLNQKHFNRCQRPVVFFISFTMGVIGFNLTLIVFNDLFPGVYSDERATGAFICGAVVITLTMNIISWFSYLLTNRYILFSPLSLSPFYGVLPRSI